MASRAAFARPTRVPTLVFRWRPTAVVPSGGIGGDDLGRGSLFARLPAVDAVGGALRRSVVGRRAPSIFVWLLVLLDGGRALAARGTLRRLGRTGLGFAIAAISGGTWSPVLVLALVLLSYVECYLDRASTMQLVVACIAGLVVMGTLEGMDLLPAQQYTHSSIERALITGVSVLLTAVLLVGRWDARSRTLTRLQRSTESLRAVNSVLDSTRTEAMARARQQQMLARLTVDAFSLAPSVNGLDSAELRHLLSRCCAVAFAELGDGWVCLRQDGGEARPVAEYGQPLSKDGPRFARHWPVHVLGKPWGRLSVEARGMAGQSVALSANDRLFVDGIVSLITASMGRVATARALREKDVSKKRSGSRPCIQGQRRGPRSEQCAGLHSSECRACSRNRSSWAGRSARSSMALSKRSWERPRFLVSSWAAHRWPSLRRAPRSTSPPSCGRSFARTGRPSASRFAWTATSPTSTSRSPCRRALRGRSS